MRKTKELSYCAQAVKDHDRDRFLQSLFVPPETREKILAVLALEVELAHVRRSVSEEMLGHIRYAWWEESLAMIAEGKKPREHPVLLALEEIIRRDAVSTERLMQRIESYRAHYPDNPPEQPFLEDICVTIIRTQAPQAEQGWKKAERVIKAHRALHGKRHNGRLAMKLLWSGARP